MSSGFVSAGTNEQPIERDDEWLKVQQELEEERRRKAEIGKQDDGKSLFEVLERNKSKPNLLTGGQDQRIHIPGNLADMLG
jgi:ABC-type lipoprotein export system ATPase subunit